MDEDNVDDIVQMLENKKSFTDYGYGKRYAEDSLMMFMTEDQKLFVEYSTILVEFAAYLQKVRIPYFYALPVHHKFSVTLLLSNFEACNQLIFSSLLEK